MIQSLLAAAIFSATIAQENNEPPGPYTHLLYGRAFDNENGTLDSQLVLHRYRPLTNADNEESVRPIWSLPHFRNLVGVVNGHIVIGGTGGGLVECVSLEAGTKTQSTLPATAIALDKQRGCVYFAASGSTLVKRFTIATREETLLFSGRQKRPATMAGFGHASLALSPDGRKLAVATLGDKRDQPEMFQEEFEVHLISLLAPGSKPVRIPGTFRGHTILTGGGDRLEAPALMWLEPTRLLIATTNPHPAKKTPVGIGARLLGHERAQIFSVDVGSLKRKQVCEVSGAVSAHLLGNALRMRADGTLILTTEKGTFRLDLIKGSGDPDLSLSPFFRFQSDDRQRMLLSKNRRLAQSVSARDVFVSPDGRESVWLQLVRDTTTNRSWIHAPKHMFHSIAGAKPTKLAEGRFESAGLVWLRESDLKATNTRRTTE